MFELKVFECKVFFHNRFKHGNFDKNTKPCTFFGYSFDSHGYDVLDITSKSIIIIYDTYLDKSSLESLDSLFFHSLNL